MRRIGATAVVMMGLCATEAFAEPVRMQGTIGPFDIVAELEALGGGADLVAGRYRYAGRAAWLTLQGEVFGRQAMEIVESADGQETGRFFLNVERDALRGYWAAGETHYPVVLPLAQGALAELLPKPNVPEISPGLVGKYFVGRHWVNDWFAPNYEIGFNGGTVNVAEIDADTLLVHFDFIVGPTYHFATFRGIARRTGAQTFEHHAVLSGGSEPCHLTFRFEVGQLALSDNNGPWACQFGARAHANFTLEKISNTAEFHDQW